MPSSEMLRRVALVRTDISEERMASLTLLVTANILHRAPILIALMMEEIRSSETSDLTMATRRHIPEEGILHRHHRENLKSYIASTGWAL
jgi:hypothetical protein